MAIQVVPDDDGSLIWSPSRGGLTEDPNAELSRIYDRFIGRLNEPEDKSRRDEAQIFREVYRKAFTSPTVAEKLQEHEIVAPLASHTFKYAWKNGTWNVYETLSFDMVDADSIERKAHAWFGRSVHLAESNDNASIHYLLGKPSVSNFGKHYAQAKDILRSARNVSLIEEDESDDFAKNLASEITKALH